MNGDMKPFSPYKDGRPWPRVTSLCSSSSAITYSILWRALLHSDIYWAVPKAQYAGMLHMVSCQEFAEEQELAKTLAHPSMMGIPVVIDEELKNSVIQLRLRQEVLFTIDSLAVPIGFD